MQPLYLQGIEKILFFVTKIHLPASLPMKAKILIENHPPTKNKFLVAMPNFTKKEIIQEVSDRLSLTQKMSSKIFHLVLEIVTRELANANNVVVRDFGTFEAKIAKGRPGRNPKDPNTTIPIPTRAVVKFQVGKALKEKVGRTLPELESRVG